MSKHGDRMKAAVKQKTSHPTHHGMRMQVHHLISKNSITLIKSKIKSGLKKKGYDIDDLSNLVSLPNDYWGACHLEVQLHRSNHRAATQDDDGHPVSYHEYVSELINREFRTIDFDQYCDSKKLQRKMNGISEKILAKINKFKISLTEKQISDNFESGQESGCRDIGPRDGIDAFRDAQKDVILCKMQNRSDKRNLLTKNPQQHFPTIFKYTLKTGN